MHGMAGMLEGGRTGRRHKGMAGLGRGSPEKRRGMLADTTVVDCGAPRKGARKWRRLAPHGDDGF